MRCIGLLVFCLNVGLVVPAANAHVADVPAGVLLIADAKGATAAPRAAATAAKKPAAKKPAVRKKPAASKSKSRKAAEVIATPVPAPNLDLSLPKDMVKDLKPPTQPARPEAQTAQVDAGINQKPILPAFFGEKGSEDFQLNGRLLNNEMQLQRRNEGRDIEGAALDFKFKQ